jgi:hypothetical protein
VEAIEFDLHDRFGLDLLDFFRGRYSWRKLLALILQLPRTSRFREAQLDDDEWARQVAHLPAASGGSPPMSTFTPEVELLTYIGESLQAIRGTLVQLGGGKPGAVTPLPRPSTALDRAREAARMGRLSALVDEVDAAMRRYVETTGG